MIDMVLAGDNAVVIGLAAAGLPAKQRKRAIIIGILTATALRIAFASIETQLLQIFRLLLAGGVLLLWVCWKMWLELHETHDCRNGRSSMLVQSPVNSRRFRPQPWLLCPSFASASTTEHAPCKPRETHRERLTVASPRLERYADGQLNLAPLHEPFRATFPPIGAETTVPLGGDHEYRHRHFGTLP